MDAQLCLVTENVINGEKKFIVPVNQRPYSWTHEHVGELIDDIWQSAKAGDKEYFIGSIFCISPEAEGQRYEIVDGQQRLITLTLILLELSKRTEQIKKAKDGKFSHKAYRLRQKVVQEEDDDGIGGSGALSLLVRKEERDFYQKCIIGQEEINNRPKLTSAEKTFKKNQETVKAKLAKFGDQEIEKFTDHLLNKVKVVFVVTNDRFLSYHLFNVLNNRGLQLDDSDLIKNELLFAAHRKNKSSFKTVEEKWGQIETLVGVEKLNDFLALQVVSEKQDRDRAKDRTRYAYFKKKLKALSGDSVKISEDLLRSSQNRESFLRGDFSKNESIRFLKRFAKPIDWEPVFMAFLNRSDLRENFPSFVSFFEKVYMHRFLGSGEGEKACYYAVQAINTGKKYDEILDHIAVLEQNKALERALGKNDFYVPNSKSNANSSKTIKAILLRIEDARRDESFTADYNLVNITLEHILPQKMTNPYWKEQGFSSEIHEEWCHKLGNLTLLLQRSNARAQNFGFDEKKKAYQKPKKKLLDITKEVCDFSEWNLEALETRHKRLKKELLDLWKITKDPQKKLLDNS